MKLARTVVLALLVAVTACSGSSKAKVSVSNTTEPTTEAPTTTAAAAVNTSDPFCSAAAKAGYSFNPSATPAAFKANFEEALAHLRQAAAHADASIRVDLQVLVNDFQTFDATMVKVSWDVTKLNPADYAFIQSPQFVTASQHLRTYAKAHCGLDLPGPGA